MTSLSGPEISGPHNDVGEIVRSWSGPETPGVGPATGVRYRAHPCRHSGDGPTI